jgi:hypothetical protein
MHGFVVMQRRSGVEKRIYFITAGFCMVTLGGLHAKHYSVTLNLGISSVYTPSLMNARTPTESAGKRDLPNAY